MLAAVFWAALLCSPRPAFPQAEEGSGPLTVERIFASGELKLQEVAPVEWSARRGGYTTLEPPADKQGGRDLVWHDPATGKREVLIPAHHFTPDGAEAPLSIEAYTFSDDESKLLIYTGSKRVWRLRSRGDYWVLDIAAHELKKLGGDAPPASLMFAKFSPDGSRVAYVRDNNLYAQDLRDLRITALTTDGSAKISNGTFDWVYEEELQLRDGFRWSPDSKQIAYWQIDASDVREFPLVDNLAGLYGEVQTIPYPKVGEKNSLARVGVIDASGGPTRWLDVPGDPREHYIAALDWAGNSSELALQQFNRLQNTNRLMLADAASGKVQTILTERDDAWVENDNAHLRWLPDHKRFVWLSERDGWQHAYLVSRDGRSVSPITKGDFDVIGIEALDPQGEWLYFLSSPENPTQRYLYRARIDVKQAGSTQIERLSPADEPGTHGYNISPDGGWAIHTWSTFGQPPLTELIRLPEHTTVRVLADNRGLKKKLAAMPRPDTEMFRVDIGGGVLLDGWCISPPDFDREKRYPVLFHVYGEPAGQTVLDRWGGRRHLWHLMLAQQGYFVISVDNRGTPAPRGREWRKCIYRQVGILASADQAAAARTLLKQRPWLDPERVAVWGWSGGGSMTLNALLRYPKLYSAGMSIAPVPNQRFYDTIYQERYMGLPSDNAEGYRLGSPITFAKQLEGDLLLVHGTGDDNCHYQGSEALINELIASNKQFTMFAYPGRTHGISEGRNTTRHLQEMLTRFLREHVPPGAR